MNNEFAFTIPENLTSGRLDSFLSLKLKMTRSQVVKKLKNDEILAILNSKKVTKSGTKIKTGDLLKITVTENFTKINYEIYNKIAILFENSNFAIIDKPDQISTIDQNSEKPSIVKFLQEKKICPKLFADDRLEMGGLVHRIDKPTQGLLICAKNRKSYDELKRLFRDRRIEKTYQAICTGELPKIGVIKSRLEKIGKRVFISTAEKAKDAVTKFEIVEKENRFNLLKIRLETGRTHQARVHLSSIGCPILGDSLYKGERFDRLCLIAKDLRFSLFNKKFKFTSTHSLRKIFSLFEQD